MAIGTLYINVSGNNNNSGSSTNTAADASGSGAATTASSATVNLIADTPTLVAGMVGQTIRLNGRTDGVRSTDIFEITAINNTLKTVTVTPTPSSTTSGVTWAIGGAFATFTRTALVVQAGTVVWAKSGTYNESVTISQFGTSTAPVVWNGYNTNPTEADQYTNGAGVNCRLDGGGSIANGLVASSGSNHNVFKFIRFSAFANNGVSGAAADFLTFKYCQFDNNGAAGAVVDANCIFESCLFDSNGTHGLDVRADAVCVGCISRDNGGDGFRAEAGVFYKCIADSNDDNGFTTLLTGTHCFFNCVVFGNTLTNTGFSIANAFSTTTIAVANCIVESALVGFRGSTGFSERASVRRSLVFDIFADNTVDFNSWPNTSTELREDDPYFSEPEVGNFYPLSGSDAIGTGYDPGTYGYPDGLGNTTAVIGTFDTLGAGGSSSNGRMFSGILTGGGM
jgi:hypothetical protein